MNQATLMKRLGQFVEEMNHTLTTKTKEYNANGPAFQGLDHAQRTLGIKPEIALWLMCQKHINAIEIWLREGNDHPLTESVRVKLIDIANYCALMAALTEGEEE